MLFHKYSTPNLWNNKKKSHKTTLLIFLLINSKINSTLIISVRKLPFLSHKLLKNKTLILLTSKHMKKISIRKKSLSRQLNY
jgi:hypothetical protein